MPMFPFMNTPQPARREYIKGQRLAVKLPNGNLEEIEESEIPKFLFAGKWIPDTTPLTGLPVIVL